MPSGIYPRQKTEPIIRFREKWKLSTEHSYDGEACWKWTACKNKWGYSQFLVDGKMLCAYRWAYEHYRKPIPNGLELDHLCRVRHCVNPSHLEPVTHLENCRRGKSGRRAHSSGQHNLLKTHCLQGHSYDEENTYFSLRGWRHCRICTLESNQRSRARREVE